MEWLLAVVALVSVAGTFGLGIAQLVYANRRAREIDARDVKARDYERWRAQDDARAGRGARRHESRVAAIENFARVCNEAVARMRVQETRPLGQRDWSEAGWASTMEQISVGQTAAWAAATGLGVDVLGNLEELWRIMQDYGTALAKEHAGDEDDDGGAIVVRLAIQLAAIEVRLGDLDKQAG